MKTYPELLEKVSFAGPDVVVNYKNPVSPYDAEGWVKQTVSDVDSLIGIYDIHAYPGQGQVRAGEYKEILAMIFMPIQDKDKYVPVNIRRY